MKIRSLLFAIGLAGGMLVSGCYDPYYYSSRGGTVVGEYDYEPGYVVRALPRGYRTTVIDGTRYYHFDGVYYRARGNSYVVVDRPPLLSSRDFDVDGIPNRYDRRYRQNVGDVYRDDGYRDVVVVDREDRGRVWNRERRPYHSDRVEVIERLPGNYRVIDYSGERYYLVDDRYYRPRGDVYIRVAPPF